MSQTATVKGLEYLIEKLLHVFDPILDPIMNYFRNLMVWLRNHLFGKKKVRPVVMTEAEYDASKEDSDPVLLVSHA